MAAQFVWNLVIAAVWMFLHSDWSLASFFAGYLAGLLLMILLGGLLGHPLYVRRLWACVKLLLLFLKELVLANVAVLRHVLRPRLAIRPGIFMLQTNLTSDLELLLLTSLITLTPGTLSLEVSEDKRRVYIHALDVGDAAQAAQAIRNTFEKAIMEVTRS